MGFSKFFVKIEPDPEVFFPGQVVKGNVYASATSPVRCRVVDINFSGYARVYWTEAENFEEAKEDYFNKGKKLFNGSSDTVKAGDYVWPFQFTLPKDIPSSFEGQCGYVRYCIKATADIPLGLNDKNKVYISVSDTADLNSDTKAKEPLCIKKSDTTGFWFWTKGPVQLNFNCPRSGAVVGERFKIRGEISNEGSKPVENTIISLSQEVEYHANKRYERRSNEISRIERGAIKPGEYEHYDDVPLKIESVPPNLRNCKIMKLEYKISVTVKTGMYQSISDSAILHIGTVPFIPEGMEKNSSIYPTIKSIGCENPDNDADKNLPPGFEAVSGNPKPPPGFVAVPENSLSPLDSVVVPGNPFQEADATLTNPYGLKGAPAAVECYFCTRKRRRRVDTKSTPPKYLSYDRILQN